MRIVLFVHSLVSDWNHGNAHFLRGIVSELLHRGHDVRVLEPRDGWSRSRLLAEQGRLPLRRFAEHFPHLRSELYDLESLDLGEVLDGAELVLVHEWNEPELVARVGRARQERPSLRALFHDTHHRAVTAPEEVARFDLGGYDGVLAFGAAIRDVYLERGWADRAWTWHEAADLRVFRPLRPDLPRRDLVWIGNWGDGERSDELREFLLEPAGALGLTGTIHGVRYPRHARAEVQRSGLAYHGWVANHDAPAAFARHRVTVHVPRRPYAEALPGIPTIRAFEALACGIPLVSAPWQDVEGLFRADDYLAAANGREMVRLLREVLGDPELALSLAASGLETIRERHSCAHRVAELLAIADELRPAGLAA
jgi:spore maturation protein CgeB